MVQVRPYRKLTSLLNTSDYPDETASTYVRSRQSVLLSEVDRCPTQPSHSSSVT